MARSCGGPRALPADRIRAEANLLAGPGESAGELNPTPAEPTVLIAGGGIAGMEALLALADLAGDRVELVLAAPEPDFRYRPMAVDEPFSLTPYERRALAPAAAELGGRFVQAGVRSVWAED